MKSGKYGRVQDLTKDQIAENARKFFANMAKKPTPELVTA
jgi:hypothetical protein